MKLQRYEILLPLLYNDGKKIEKEKFLKTHEELLNKFEATTFDSTRIIGRWIYHKQLFEDRLMKVVVDVPIHQDNEVFFKQYKKILKKRFKQVDIWITSYEINII